MVFLLTEKFSARVDQQAVPPEGSVAATSTNTNEQPEKAVP